MAVRTINASYPLEDSNTFVFKGWGDTRVKVCKFIYAWTIHNFMLWYEGSREMLISPTFPVGTNHGLKWNLRFQSRRDTKENNNTMHFPIHLTLAPSSNKPHVQAKYKVSILSEDQNKFQTKEGFRQIVKGVYFAGVDCAINKATLLDEKNRLLPDDKLTIYCEITTLSEHLTDHTTMLQCNLSVDMGLALASDEFSDVVLNVKGEYLQAHKVILAARSPVFKAMFSNEMTESNYDEVVITDICKEVIEEMLNFIYTGEASVGEISQAMELFTAAEKFQLKRLKIICEKYLCNNLSPERITELYKFASQDGAKELKIRAQEYIVTHAKDVIVTQEWKALVKTHPKLYEEVFDVLVAQQVPSISAICDKNN